MLLRLRQHLLLVLLLLRSRQVLGQLLLLLGGECALLRDSRPDLLLLLLQLLPAARALTCNGKRGALYLGYNRSNAQAFSCGDNRHRR